MPEARPEQGIEPIEKLFRSPEDIAADRTLEVALEHREELVETFAESHRVTHDILRLEFGL
jgi:hypothetical protein